MSFARLVAAGCLACLVAGCGGNGEDGSEQTRQFANGGTYTTALGSDPGNLHPLKAVQITTNNVISFAYDSLVNLDENGEVVPQLAETWKVSDDRVTFTVREGVTCEDGTELTAGHVAANFEWVKKPANASSYLGSSLPSADYTVETDAAARTVTITLAQPYGFLLQGAGFMPIVCPDGLADPTLLSQETDGTGPFVLTEYAADDHMTMQAREDYAWGPGGVASSEPGFPARVVFRIVQNPTTAVNLFLDGELSDVAPGSQDEARVQGQGQDYFTLETESGPLEMYFNQRTDSVTTDPALRRALTMGVDLDALTEVMSEGEGVRATDLTVNRPDPCVADSVEGLPGYDAAGAGDALEEAGWTVGSDGIRTKDGEPLALTVSYPSGEDATTAGMELLSQQWEEIGVDVQLKGQASNAFLQTLFAGAEWDVAFLNVQVAYPPELVSFLSGPAPPEGQNFAAIENSDYDRLAEEAARTPGQEGCDLWAQAERALIDRQDVVPIANQVGRTYADGAEFAEGVRSAVEPTSIRLFTG